MTNISFYLDFLIAFIFILAIGSTILSIIYEVYAYYFKHRGKFLRRTIEDVLNDIRIKDANLAELFYNHPQIDLTKKTYRSLPAYISSRNFAQTLIEVICRKYESRLTRITNDPEANAEIIQPNPQTNQFERFRISVEALPYSDLKILLNSLINHSEQKTEKLQASIENWFNEYMNRAGGWYKIMVQKRMIIMAFIVCIVINIDFFRVGSTLLTDKELTHQISIQAEKYQPAPRIDTISNEQQLAQALQAKQKLLDSLYRMNAPIGWQNEGVRVITFRWLFLKLLGWLLSAVALSFGAPFWFDLLSRFVNIRKAGIKPKTDQS